MLAMQQLLAGHYVLSLEEFKNTRGVQCFQYLSCSCINRTKTSLHLIFKKKNKHTHTHTRAHTRAQRSWRCWRFYMTWFYLWQVQTCLRDLGLTNKSSCYPQRLSGGQKRKLCVALALIGNSKVAIPPCFSSPHSKVMVVRSYLSLNGNFKTAILCSFLHLSIIFAYTSYIPASQDLHVLLTILVPTGKQGIFHGKVLWFC